MRFVELDKAGLHAIRKTWMDAIAAMAPGAHRDVFEADYQQLFERIATGGEVGSLKECLNKELFTAICDNGSHPWALVELVQTRKGRATWIKMLDIYMSPEIEAEADNPPNVQKRLEVFTAAIIGIFELTKGIKGVDTVKVYGRTESLITFLRGMQGALSGIISMGTIPGVEVSIEGRWLVFRSA